MAVYTAIRSEKWEKLKAIGKKGERIFTLE
jgi:hypothetical protein